MLYGDPRLVYSKVGTFGERSFNCNHLPIVNDEPTRLALAFWREGQRLRGVHDGYAFLSFYKVIESQFAKGDAQKVAWFTAALAQLKDRAGQRVAALGASGVDVSRHLFESGRCAVAHASLAGDIVDPDIPADRRRLRDDLDVMEALAQRFIAEQLAVPDELELDRTRDRLEPWHSLLPEAILKRLRSGEACDAVPGIDGLEVSIGFFPDGPLPELERMTLQVHGVNEGVVSVAAVNAANSISLVFALDFPHGRIHTNVETSGMSADRTVLTEQAAEACFTFVYRVIANGIAEMTAAGREPVDCEVVIPVNIIPQDPVVAVAEAMTRFRQRASEDEQGRG